MHHAESCVRDGVREKFYGGNMIYLFIYHEIWSVMLKPMGYSNSTGNNYRCMICDMHYI